MAPERNDLSDDRGNGGAKNNNGLGNGYDPSDPGSVAGDPNTDLAKGVDPSNSGPWSSRLRGKETGRADGKGGQVIADAPPHRGRGLVAPASLSMAGPECRRPVVIPPAYAVRALFNMVTAGTAQFNAFLSKCWNQYRGSGLKVYRANLTNKPKPTTKQEKTMAHRLYRRAAMTAVGLTTPCRLGRGRSSNQAASGLPLRTEPSRRGAFTLSITMAACGCAPGDADATGTVAQPFAGRIGNAPTAARGAAGAAAQGPAHQWPDCRYEPNFPMAAPYWIDHNGCLRMRRGNEDAFVTGSIGQVNANPPGRVGAGTGARPGIGPGPDRSGGTGTGTGPVANPPTGTLGGNPAVNTPVNTPVANIPNVDAPKAEGPKTEGPKSEGPKSEGPKSEGPKGDGPKGDGPKGDGPKGDGPKGEGPKGDGPKGGGKGHGSEKGKQRHWKRGRSGAARPRGARWGLQRPCRGSFENPGGQMPGSGNASARGGHGDGGGRGNSKSGK